ncbi:hypothetical protein FQN49_007976, partial [Arthroderma sp. PD_2]
LYCTSNENEGRVILFSEADYRGVFSSFRVRPASGSSGNTSTEIRSIRTAQNDNVSSLIIIRVGRSHLAPIPISRLLAPATINRLVSDLLGGGVKLRGAVIVTWDLYPHGQPFHINAPEQRFIMVEVPLKMESPGPLNRTWYIWVRFWIYLWVEGGRLRGHVHSHRVRTDNIRLRRRRREVERQANQRAAAAYARINDELRPALNLVNATGTFSNVYYLPGNGSATAQGHTDNGISIVLVRA